MKNLLLILVMLITGIINAQDCNPDICDGCCDVFEPETTEFDFNPDNCVVDFEAVKTELNDVVDLFFTELATHNEGALVHPAYLYPFIDIVRSDYLITINTFPFTYGAAADVACPVIEDGKINVEININENKWHEFTDDEHLGFQLDSNGNPVLGNDDNPVLNIRALAYLKKRLLIYHELGHAVLGLDHPCDSTKPEIMKTSQCFRANGSQYHISFPDDFPVANITDFDEAVNRMHLGHFADQVYGDPCPADTSSSTTSTSAATYPSQSTAAAQAPRERYEGETELEYYGDTDLTNDQLQNRIDAIDDIDKPETMTTKYGWETLNQEYFIQLTDITFNPIVSEVAAVANLTTLTYSEFEDLVDWTIVWRNAFLSKIADNNL